MNVTLVPDTVPRSRPYAGALLLLLLLAASGLGGCARVLQKDREYLSDPILQLDTDALGNSLESHNLPRREGSAGGGSGSGGGCGC